MAQKIIRYYLLIALSLGCISISSDIVFADTQDIRVAVLKDAKDFTLTVRGKYTIMDAADNSVLLEARTLRKAKVYATKDGIKINQYEFSSDYISIVSKRDARIYINKRRFRGKIDIKRQDDSRLTVINTVDIEQYIKGVMYHEVSHRWPLEALKAQAVAARTYALNRKKINEDNDYDVTSDIYSQVYGGRGSERYRTNVAVNRTKGLVLVYKGEILPAYYHATCAGQTEDVSELWKDDLPPLKGVPCNYCKRSPHFHWKKNIRLKSIQDKLNAKGYDIWLIKTIEVLSRNKTGRIKTLKITARNGKTVTVAGKDFRDIVGPNLIKSNNYEVVMKGYYADFIGKGWGHGVGLCQWGANFMARERYDFDYILKYYYPGAEIVDYSTLH